MNDKIDWTNIDVCLEELLKDIPEPALPMLERCAHVLLWALQAKGVEFTHSFKRY